MRCPYCKAKQDPATGHCSTPGCGNADQSKVKRWTSPHDTDDFTDSSDLDDDEQVDAGLVDDTDYGDSQPSAYLPWPRDLAMCLIPGLFQG
jgi:hypothetical protein